VGAERVFSTVCLCREVRATLIALLMTVLPGVVSARGAPAERVAVGFPPKVAVALLVVGASMPFLSGWIPSTRSPWATPSARAGGVNHGLQDRTE
jgi:hypothetical protein